MNMAKIVLIILIGSMLGGCAGSYWEYHDPRYRVGYYPPSANQVPLEDYDGKYAGNPGAEAALARGVADAKRREQRAIERQAYCEGRGGCRQVRAWDGSTRFDFQGAFDPAPPIVFIRP